MRKWLWIWIIALGAPAFAAQQAVNGFCTVGGVKVSTQGMNSTTTVQASYPQCTVTVFDTGTTNLSTIFDALGNQIVNPFTANTNASWLFYGTVGNGYDIQMSGGIPNQFSQPFTLTDVVPGGSGGGGAGNPAPPAFAVQLAAPSLSAFAADGFININPTTHTLTARVLNGALDTDSFITGSGNNGISNAQAAQCSTPACFMVVPPTSTDTEIANPLPPISTATSSLVIDERGNQFGIAGTDPQPTQAAGLTGGQSMETVQLNFFNQTPSGVGQIQGNFQGISEIIDNNLAPGYSGGQPCPLMCPTGSVNINSISRSGTTVTATLSSSLPLAFVGGPVGIQNVTDTSYDGQFTIATVSGSTVTWTQAGGTSTSSGGQANSTYPGGSALWSAPRGYNTQFNCFNEGICNYSGGNIWCLSVGDCGGFISSFVLYEGGFVAPSDEGAKGGQSAHINTGPDWVGTITGITDTTHLKAINTSGFPPGAGRFLVDTKPVVDQSSLSLFQIYLDQINGPNTAGFYPGTFVMNSANFAVSTGIGTLAQSCIVPIQTNTVQAAQCVVNVTSGSFVVSGQPVCLASNTSNNYSCGQITAVATAGSVQTITVLIHHSIASGGIVMQGSMSSTAIDGASDVNESLGYLVHGSTFPILGCFTSTTCAYANYDSSQVWGSIPNLGSQMRTTATSGIAAGGFTLSNLVRTSNLVTATVTSGFTGFPNNNVQLNGALFFKISGCSDTTFNTPGPVNDHAAYFVGTDPTHQTIAFPQTGANSTCSSATLVVEQALASIYYSSQIYDVVNRDPGAYPVGTLGLTFVDGTFMHGYQPNYANGDPLDVPPHYSANVNGTLTEVGLAQPVQGSMAVNVILDAYSGFGNAAFSAQSNASTFLASGFQGNAAPGDLIDGNGLWGNGLNMSTAPLYQGAVIRVGFPTSDYCEVPGGGCSIFENYDVLNLDENAVRLHYDSPSETFSWLLNFGNSTPLTISQTAVAVNTAAVLQSAQFEALTPTGFIPSTQFHTSSPFADVPGPVSYDIVIPGVVAVTQVGTAGSTEYTYGLEVTTLYGRSSTFFGGQNLNGQTFTGNATLSTSNYNVISCATLPSGMTATVYEFHNTTDSVRSVGTCSSGGSVNDQGLTYGADQGRTIISAGAALYSGSFGSVGAGNPGFFFTQPDTFGTTTPSSTITAGISQLSNGGTGGILCVYTTTSGTCSGEIDTAVVKVGGVSVVPATHGSIALVAGTATVTNSAAQAIGGTHGYELTNCIPSGTAIGVPSVTTVTAGTSFVITSKTATNTTATGDTSTVCWSAY